MARTGESKNNDTVVAEVSDGSESSASFSLESHLKSANSDVEDNIYDLKENYNITKQIEITKKPAKKKIYFAGDKNIKNIIREGFNKKIDDVIREQNGDFEKLEKHMKAQYDEIFSKNELELKNKIKTMRDNTVKFIMETIDQKFVQNVSNIEQTCAKHLNKFQKDLEDHGKAFKTRTQSELDVISNELKSEFRKNSNAIMDNWSHSLKSFEDEELQRLRSKFIQNMENVERNVDVEIRQFNSDFKEKLKMISEDKLHGVAEQLDVALREEINLVKKRINENCKFNINNDKTPCHKCQLEPLVNCSERERDFECQISNKVNCSNVKKIQQCSDNLNDARKFVHKIPSTSKYVAGSDTCTVSCQTEKPITSRPEKPSAKDYNYSESLHTPYFDSYDMNTKHDVCWNKAKTSQEIFSHHMTEYPLTEDPLDVLRREEMKVKEVEQNICRLTNSLSNVKQSNYRMSNNNDYYQKNYYRGSTSSQIDYNKTKDLREWLYKTKTDFKYKRI